MDKAPGKHLDGRLPAGYEVTQYTDNDYHVGAYQDLCTRATTKSVFSAPIYFHPALMQRAAECLPEIDDDDVNDMVAIPVSTHPVMKHNPLVGDDDIYYRLYIDLYRPTRIITDGGVYDDAAKSGQRQILLGQNEQVSMGDTLFVVSNEGKSTMLCRVADDTLPPVGDKRPVELDPDDPVLPDDIVMIGWVIEEATPMETLESVSRIVESHLAQSTIQPPIMAGVCGPLQPIVMDMVLLQ